MGQLGQRFKVGDKIRNGPKVGRLDTYNPFRLGVPQCFILGDKISSGPEVDQVTM